jgi:hypothetical protein
MHWEPIQEVPIAPHASPKDENEIGPRPRIIPIKPKYDIVVCRICMGRIKQGLNVAKCTCGKSFHDVCLERTGFCPYCQKPYDAPAVAAISVKNERPKREKVQCLSCGRTIDDDARQCECGAVFVEDDRFDCAICGSVVFADTMVCGHCGDTYQAYTPMLCPICSKVFNREKGMCECGAFIGDSCPECGIPLERDDRACPRCGTLFEYVGTPDEIAGKNPR